MRSQKTRTRRDDPAQSRLFIKKAKEVEADETASASDTLIRHLAAKRPEPRKPSK